MTVIPSPAHWLEIIVNFGPTVQNHKLEQAAREVLAKSFPDTLSTAQLVEALWPARFAAKGDGAWTAREQLFKMLRYLSKHALLDCNSQGEPKPGKGPFKGKMVRPTLWHSPDAKPAAVTCKTCGQVIP